METANTHMQKHTLSNLQRRKKRKCKRAVKWHRHITCECGVEEDRPSTEERRDKREYCDRKRSPTGESRGGGLGWASQRIWVLANAALSSADHDNLTICFSARDSRLWVTLAAPIGRIYCQAETSDEARIVTSYKIFWGSGQHAK